jgi:Flp pilus assembly protein protease CpaA
VIPALSTHCSLGMSGRGGGEAQKKGSMESVAAWRVVLSLLLIVVAAWDLRTKRVPHLVAWPLLLLAVAARTWQGSWLLLPLFVGLVLVELLPQVWRGPGIVLLVGGAQWGAQLLSDPAAQFIALWWGVAYMLWTLHVLGGGDTRVFMALVALFPETALVAALWGGLALVSIAWLLVLYRRSAWSLLAQAGQSISGGRYPSQEELAEQGKPSTPGLVLGALTYLWVIVGRT